MRFRDLKPVKFSEIPISTYFWAEQVDEPARMSDLYGCIKTNETYGTHMDQGHAYRYEFTADEVVYVRRKKAKMNERAKLAQIIVQAIEEFPKVHKFLTSGDTGCHPQHFVDTIAKRIVESQPTSETLRENILTGFAAELKAMLTEAQEENEELVTICEALTDHIVGMYASGGKSLEVVIKARAAIARNRGD